MGTTFDKLKGKAKKAEGQATDDKLREAQGWAEEKKSDVEDAVDRAAEKVEEKVDEAREDREKEPPPR